MYYASFISLYWPYLQLSAFFAGSGCCSKLVLAPIKPPPDLSLFFLDPSLFQPNFSCPHISPSRESFQLKSCPYTFYHNKENPGDTLKNAHIFHISNRPIVRRLSGCEGDGQRGVFLLPLLNHGLHGEHGVHNVHHGVHLLLDHGVHAVTPARHHPPPRALSQPQASLNLKLANSKLGAGSLLASWQTTSPPVQLPDRPPGREPTSNFTHPKNLPRKASPLTSQMCRTANLGDPV